MTRNGRMSTGSTKVTGMILSLTIGCSCGASITVPAETVTDARSAARRQHGWSYSSAPGDRCQACSPPQWKPSLDKAVSLVSRQCALCGVRKEYGDHGFAGLFGHDRDGHQILRNLLLNEITTPERLIEFDRTKLKQLRALGELLVERVEVVVAALTPEVLKMLRAFAVNWREAKYELIKEVRDERLRSTYACWRDGDHWAEIDEALGRGGWRWAE